MQHSARGRAPQVRSAATHHNRRVALLSPTAVPIDDLIRLTALPPARVASVLLDLELEGVLVRHAGARVALG